MIVLVGCFFLAPSLFLLLLLRRILLHDRFMCRFLRRDVIFMPVSEEGSNFYTSSLRSRSQNLTHRRHYEDLRRPSATRFSYTITSQRTTRRTKENAKSVNSLKLFSKWVKVLRVLLYCIQLVRTRFVTPPHSCYRCHPPRHDRKSQTCHRNLYTTFRNYFSGVTRISELAHA